MQGHLKSGPVYTMISNVYTLPYLSGGFPLVLLVLLLGTGGAAEDIGLDVVLFDSLTKSLSLVLAWLLLVLVSDRVLSSR